MLDSQNDFEAYKVVLQRLQRMDPVMLPFTHTLLSCEPSGDPHAHVSARVPGGTALDENQASALQAVLGKEVGVVHGPPGSGKSYIARVALRSLLEERASRGHDARAVLVISATSHSLDETLTALLKEGVVEAARLVRIGSYLANDTLHSVDVWHRVVQERCAEPEKWQGYFDVLKEQDVLRTEIELMATKLQQTEPSVDDLEDSCTTAQIMSMCAAPHGWMDIEEALFEWLQLVRDTACHTAASTRQCARDLGPRQLTPSSGGHLISSPSDNPLELVHLAPNQDPDWAAVTRIKHADDEREEELWEQELLPGIEGQIHMQMEIERIEENSHVLEHSVITPLKGTHAVEWPDAETRDFLSEHDELWQLDALQRKQLVAMWIHRKQVTSREALSLLCERYERICCEKARFEYKMQLSVLQQASIIGVTATSLAKHIHLLNDLGADVIVVEDAEEILEAHVLALLSPHMCKLVLLGDVKRKRACGAFATLAKQFRCDLSLFTRLANGGKFNHLSFQHRSRPEIACLLAPAYTGIVSHVSTLHFGGVRGIEKPVFFLKHSKRDVIEPASQSRANVHEAKFLVALVGYLVRYGYAASQLAVLTPYCGQLLMLRRELHDMGHSDVMAALIDQHHGSESEIVLLSLVRSDEGQDVRLLNQESLICSALSRARCGLYIVGNAEMVGSSKLWASVLHRLEQDDAIGRFLPLLATRSDNPNRRALVSRAEDFDGLLLIK